MSCLVSTDDNRITAMLAEVRTNSIYRTHHQYLHTQQDINKSIRKCDHVYVFFVVLVESSIEKVSIWTHFLNEI